MIMTLREWLDFPVPASEVLLNTNTQDGLGMPLPYPIGISVHCIAGLPEDPERFPAITVMPTKDVFCSALFAKRMGRNATASTCAKYKWMNIKPMPFKGRHTPENYLSNMRRSQLTLSPMGGNTDCHRTYEALIFKCVPIIQIAGDLQKKYEGLPVMFSKDFSDLKGKSLQEEYEHMLDTDYDFSRLFRSYWKNLGYPVDRQSRYWLQQFGLEEYTHYHNGAIVRSD